LVYKSILQDPPVRTFLAGSQYWVVDLPSVRIGLGHFKPGWVWSEHTGAQTDMESQSHIGIIQSGKMAISSADEKKSKFGLATHSRLGRVMTHGLLGTQFVLHSIFHSRNRTDHQ
jgi:hypothetical protein